MGEIYLKWYRFRPFLSLEPFYSVLGEIYLKWYRFRPFLSLEPFYSVFILLIGFSEAARQLWTMTVSREMMKQVNPAAANIQGLSAMR